MNYSIFYSNNELYMIRAVVFDFDNTLCNVNTYSMNLIYLENKHLNNFFDDYQKVYMLLKIFNDLGIKIFIASFGKLSNIQYIVNKTFPNIFTNIYTPDQFGFKTPFIPDDCKCKSIKYNKSGYSKNLILKHIAKKYDLKFNNILYFDDDNANIDCAKLIGVCGFNNKTPLNYNIIVTIFKYFHYPNKKYITLR